MNSQSNQEQRPKGGFFSRLFNNNKNDATANEISPEMTKENHQIQEKNEPEWEIVADHEMVKVPSISDRKQARISAEQRVAFFVAEETKMRKAFDEAKRYASEAEEARRAAELEAAVKVAEEKAARFADSARESAAKATSAAEIFSAAEAEYNAAESRAELSRVEEQTLRKRIEARQVELAAHQKTLLLGMTAKANAAEGCNVDKKQLAATIATQVELMNAALEEAKAQEQTAIDDERVSVGKMSAATEARIAAVKKNQQDSEVKNIQAIAENDRAQISSQQTNHQIAEITTALSAAEEEAQRSIVDETQLQQTLAAEIADLEQKCATAIAAVKAETDRIVALGIEKRQMLQEYQALVAQIESAGITAEEASTRAALEERDAIDQAESNLSRISARVEAALSGANHKRQNYLDAQKIVEENTIASVKANAIEKGITEKVQKLLAEEKDAKIAAEMAESLVRDAMIAQESADT
ncbi:MAG: hypothetical protein RR387_06520, partial [Clostridiales bacterium]